MDNSVPFQQKVSEIVEKIGKSKEALIPILQEIQKEYKYLPQEALEAIPIYTEIKAADIVGVSTFYSQFRHKPVGNHVISVCMGTACHVKGAGQVFEAFRRELKLADNEDTDSEGLFTLSDVSCLGCCTLAPVVQIDGVTFGHVAPEGVGDVLKEFLNSDEEEREASRQAFRGEKTYEGEIRLGLGSCCLAGGSDEILKRTEETVKEVARDINIKSVGCIGVCHQTPLMEVVDSEGKEHLYAKVKEEDVRDIITSHFKPQSFFTRIMGGTQKVFDRFYTRKKWNPSHHYLISKEDKHLSAFLDKQVNIATEHCGQLEPLDIYEYKESGGFEALASLLSKKVTGEEIIDILLQSGVRGRGGAGFTTAKKWEFTYKAKGDKKIVICNGDEGDPGAFMDRMLLESYPFRVLEGMIIAAYTVGASEGYLYIRAEYPLAVERIRDAIALCEDNGYLGKNILNSGFSLKLRVKEGAGAFVCGEETALIQSIEGFRGMPEVKPPFPAISGLHGLPTLINNVESFALISWIIRNGAETFGKLGTEKSKGTKVFALAGKIKRGGLIEVPMGITLREIVEDIGGGIAGDRKLKAIQIGGPSGGCVPAAMVDVPVDYEHLSELGSMMGSGGMVVLDETDCMVDISRYFLSFTQKESCGKCTFCRVGTKRMLEIMDRICEGKGKKGDLEQLEELSHQVKGGSLCGLGKTAPNPILSTLQYFREEYEAHIEGKCPSGKCKDLIKYTITNACIGCTKCVQKCAVDAIHSIPYQKHTIDESLCTRCDACREICPVAAVKVV